MRLYVIKATNISHDIAHKYLGSWQNMVENMMQSMGMDCPPGMVESVLGSMGGGGQNAIASNKQIDKMGRTESGNLLLPEGTKVIIHGLQSRPTENGKMAIIQSDGHLKLNRRIAHVG